MSAKGRPRAVKRARIEAQSAAHAAKSAIAHALPPGCYRSPVREWWLSFWREDNGERESTRMTGTYAEVRAARDAKMLTGRYYQAWIGET